MKLKYETGVATMVQFVTLSLLGIPNALISIISDCTGHSTECVSNTLLSLIFFLLTAGFFGFIWVLGYAAQDRRSRGLARALIAAELLVALIALINAKHHNNILGLLTSIADLCLAAWVILLAVRLIRAKGGRVVASKQRPRRRPTPGTQV